MGLEISPKHRIVTLNIVSKEARIRNRYNQVPHILFHKPFTCVQTVACILTHNKVYKLELGKKDF